MKCEFMTRASLALATVLFVCSCAPSLTDEDEQPLHRTVETDAFHKDASSIRLVQYNVGAFYKSGSSSIPMISAMMEEISADVISMNEVDSVTTRTGRENQLAVFCDRMGGWNNQFFEAMPYKGGKYGLGIVWASRFKSLVTDKVPIPQGEGGEPRVLGVVEFEDFVYATVHLDNLSGNARLAGVSVILDYMNTHYGSSSKPVFVCGDFNCEPNSQPIAKMREGGFDVISSTLNTMPSDAPRGCIDYIFLRRGKKNVKVPKSLVVRNFSTGDVKVASDHLPIFVDVIL